MKFRTFLFISTLFIITINFINATAPSINPGINDHFRLPQKVLKTTKLKKPVNIYFDSISEIYELPDAKPSNSIPVQLGAQDDPIEPYNRTINAFNSFMTEFVLTPVKMTYSAVIPKYGREGIRQMNNNIQMPTRLINSLLQARFERSGIVLTRFGINTTAGIGGFYDPAKHWLDLEPYAINFNQTFRYWGIGKGCYFMLPIQGPSSIRETISLAGDYAADPLTWIPPYTFFNWISWGIKAGIRTNNMSLRLDQIRRLGKSNIDTYRVLKQASLLLNYMEKVENTENK